MIGSRLFTLEPIDVNDKEIYPVALLKLLIFEEVVYNVDYSVVALKIVENNEVYYKNISMSEEDFKKLKKGC